MPDIAPGFGGSWHIPYSSHSFQPGEAKLLVASGLSQGDLQVSPVVLETAQNFYGFSGLLAHGTYGVVSTGFNGRLPRRA